MPTNTNGTVVKDFSDIKIPNDFSQIKNSKELDRLAVAIDSKIAANTADMVAQYSLSRDMSKLSLSLSELYGFEERIPTYTAKLQEANKGLDQSSESLTKALGDIKQNVRMNDEDFAKFKQDFLEHYDLREVNNGNKITYEENPDDKVRKQGEFVPTQALPNGIPDKTKNR
jgi:hypothetical protein